MNNRLLKIPVIGIYTQNADFSRRFFKLLQQIEYAGGCVLDLGISQRAKESRFIIDLQMLEVQWVLALFVERTKDVFIVADKTQTKAVTRLIHMGVQACMLYEREDIEMLLALRSWIAGDAPIDASITAKILTLLRPQHPPDLATCFNNEIELTDREMQILYLVSEGLSNQQIATQFCLSRHTVDSHMKHIYRKLEVNKRMQAVTAARGLGLL